MPTIFIQEYEFRFYSSDVNEPPHVHVINAERVAKIWLNSLEVEDNHSYTKAELNRVLKLTKQNKTKQNYWRHGMNTLTAKAIEPVRAKSARVTANTLHVRLDDGREISVPFTEVPWLKWLAKATPKQRAKWSLEPGGYAVFWPDLDDGIEVCHLLDSQPIA